MEFEIIENPRLFAEQLYQAPEWRAIGKRLRRAVYLLFNRQFPSSKGDDIDEVYGVGLRQEFLREILGVPLQFFWDERVTLPSGYRVGKIEEIIAVFPTEEIEPKNFFEKLYKGYQTLIKLMSIEEKNPKILIVFFKEKDWQGDIVFFKKKDRPGGKKDKKKVEGLNILSSSYVMVQKEEKWTLFVALHEIGHRLFRKISFWNEEITHLLDAFPEKRERIRSKLLYLEEAFLEVIVNKYFGLRPSFKVSPSHEFSLRDFRNRLQKEENAYNMGAYLFYLTSESLCCTPLELFRRIVEKLSENPSLTLYSLFNNVLKPEGENVRSLIEEERFETFLKKVVSIFPLQSLQLHER